jgi:hypothetical protein
MQSGRLLIFVFHCDRGTLPALKDYSQTPVTDKAPECSLLALISSPVGTKKGWKRYIQELGIPARFMYHDEYEEEFGALLTPLPAVFLHYQKTRSLFISADELSRVKTLEDLTALVDQKIAALFSLQGR